MFQTVTDWLKRMRDRAELDTLDAGERDRVAQDLGVSTAELDYLVRESHDPVQLPLMLAELGINEDALRRASPGMLRDLRRVCSLCETTDTCNHMLADRIAGLTFPEFCPNAETLRALAGTRRKH